MIAPEWSLLTMAKAGVPFLVILDRYQGVVLRDSQSLLTVDARRLDQVRAMVELLGYWVSSAQTGTADNVARRELARAVTSNHLLPTIDMLKAKLETTPAARDLLDRLRSIEYAVQSSV